MTNTSNLKTRKKALDYQTVSCIVICALLILTGKGLKSGVSHGIDLSLKLIIPTLFPFFILSDYWSAVLKAKESSQISRLFERLFSIPSYCFSSFVGGIICGFPMGIKTATQIYNNTDLSKKQFTNLCAISNTPSAAFIISGIGLGIFNSIPIGIKLYLSCISSVILCGVFFRPKDTLSGFTAENTRQTFDLTESIQKAGISAISVSSYVIFFSCIVYCLRSWLKNQFITAVLASFLEICSAIELISSYGGDFQFSLIGFCIGFSTISVHMQSRSLMPKDIIFSRYLMIKFVQGILCSIICSIII